MVYIVHGATGAQGSPVLRYLRAAGKEVIAAVRHVDSLSEGIRGVSVDLADSGSLAQLYHGAEGVFIHLPLTDPAQALIYAQSIGDALHRATPSRVVISTSGAVIDSPNSPLQAPPESPIRQLISRAHESGCSVAIVAPRLFLENLPSSGCQWPGERRKDTSLPFARGLCGVMDFSPGCGRGCNSPPA